MFLVSSTYLGLLPLSAKTNVNLVFDSVISAASNKPNGGTGTADTGMNWLMYELLWRDFFRLVIEFLGTFLDFCNGEGSSIDIYVMN